MTTKRDVALALLQDLYNEEMKKDDGFYVGKYRGAKQMFEKIFGVKVMVKWETIEPYQYGILYVEEETK